MAAQGGCDSTLPLLGPAWPGRTATATRDQDTTRAGDSSSKKRALKTLPRLGTSPLDPYPRPSIALPSAPLSNCASCLQALLGGQEGCRRPIVLQDGEAGEEEG